MVEKQDCGSKHLQLAVWIVGIIIVVVGAAFGYAVRGDAGLDDRVRTTEREVSGLKVTTEELNKKYEIIINSQSTIMSNNSVIITNQGKILEKLNEMAKR